MEWEKPSGIIIQTNDDDATIKYCKSLGWVKSGESEQVDTTEVIPEKPTKKKKDVGRN